jgi:hypothetical protein
LSFLKQCDRLSPFQVRKREFISIFTVTLSLPPLNELPLHWREWVTWRYKLSLYIPRMKSHCEKERERPWLPLSSFQRERERERRREAMGEEPSPTRWNFEVSGTAHFCFQFYSLFFSSVWLFNSTFFRSHYTRILSHFGMIDLVGRRIWVKKIRTMGQIRELPWLMRVSRGRRI